MTVDERIAEIEALGQAVRGAAEVCANASFDCGEWDAADDDRTYEDVLAVSRNAKDAFEAALSAVLSSLRSARKDSEQLRASLRWALDDMEDGRPDEAPLHYCEFTVNPERGACAYHERWAEARRLLAVGSVLPELEQG